MTLKLGDHSTNVALWQGFLVKRGFGLTPDAHFGPKTENATKLFQHDAELDADGVVGPKTIAAARARGFAGFPGQSTHSEDPKSSAVGKLILVSAGHSTAPGGDRGAVGNGYVEANLAVEIRDGVALELRRKGLSVIEDGADGVSEPLSKAVLLAKKSDIAVEFHWNAGSSTANGVEVLSKPVHKSLAQRLAKAIADPAGLKLRGEGGWKAENSGPHQRLAFISDGGGLIVEVAFITNRADMTAYEANKYTIVRNLAEVLAGA